MNLSFLNKSLSFSSLSTEELWYYGCPDPGLPLVFALREGNNLTNERVLD